MSSRYEMLEDKFIKIAKEGDRNSDAILFRVPEAEKLLLDNFNQAKNNAMLWQCGTMDANGKSMISDRKGRPMNLTC